MLVLVLVFEPMLVLFLVLLVVLLSLLVVLVLLTVLVLVLFVMLVVLLRLVSVFGLVPVVGLIFLFRRMFFFALLFVAMLVFAIFISLLVSLVLTTALVLAFPVAMFRGASSELIAPSGVLGSMVPRSMRPTTPTIISSPSRRRFMSRESSLAIVRPDREPDHIAIREMATNEARFEVPLQCLQIFEA
jgi:hypothetical protein